MRLCMGYKNCTDMHNNIHVGLCGTVSTNMTKGKMHEISGLE